MSAIERRNLELAVFRATDSCKQAKGFGESLTTLRTEDISVILNALSKMKEG